MQSFIILTGVKDSRDNTKGKSYYQRSLVSLSITIESKVGV